MSKAKKLLTIASIGAFLLILGKSIRKLYPNTSAVAAEIPDAMGYTAAMRAEAVFVQSEKLEKSRLEFDEGYYDEILNRCRTQQEFFLTYILKCENLYKFPPHPPVVLHHLISKCKKHNLLSAHTVKNLDIAKKYCNSGSHYNDSALDSDNILFAINATTELFEIWKMGYAEK